MQFFCFLVIFTLYSYFKSLKLDEIIDNEGSLSFRPPYLNPNSEFYRNLKAPAMANKKRKPTYFSRLSQRAEDALEVSSDGKNNSVRLNSDGIKELIHDLQLHQIELEMQNDEIKRTQEELDTERNRYFDFYNLAPVGFFSVDDQKIILECNLTAATLLERSLDELVKQPITRFIIEEDQDIYYLHSNQAFQTKTPQECNLRMLKNDGSAIWVQLATTTVRNTGDATICRIVMSNITERMLAEEMLLEQEKLQGVLEMSGAICHELNQPLQVISGSAELLLMNIEKSDPDYKTLKNIEVSINRMALLMHKIMGINRYQSKPYLKNKIVDIEQASRNGKGNNFP